MTRSTLGRRRFLVAAGLGSGAVLAGCGGPRDPSGESDGGRPLASDAGVLDGGALDAPRGRDASSTPGRGLNILLVTCDQMRHPSMMPASVSLPALEGLAARGISFAKHQITAAPCTPSRSVIYTGQHAPRTAMIDNINFPFVASLSPSTPTLGHALRAAGYHTAYKGKWHLSEIDDTGCRITPTTDALEPYGFADYNDCGDVHGIPQSGLRDDGDTASAAARWLRERAPALDRPWFLSVNFVNPHDIMFIDTDGTLGLDSRTQRSQAGVPLLAVPRTGVYADRHAITLPSTLVQGFSGRPAAHAELERIYAYTFGEIPTARDDLWRTYLEYYVNCQRDVDAHVSTVLDALAATGQLDRTIVVYTADHGELGGAHGSRQKGCFVYRENLHVPLVVAHPDVRGPSTVTSVTSVLDLPTTILGLAGVSEADRRALQPQMRGHDLSTLLARPSDPGPRAASGALFTYDALSTVDADFAIANASGLAQPFGNPCVVGTPDTSKRGFLRGIYDGRYRFARYFAPDTYNRPASFEALVRDNDLELYDTELDPEERTNLASPELREAHRDAIEAMRVKLEALLDAELDADDDYAPPTFEPCG
jgi:arylsulfatase A-like enzyme